MAQPSRDIRIIWRERHEEEQNAQADTIASALRNDAEVLPAVQLLLQDKSVVAAIRGAVTRQASSEGAATRDYGAWLKSLSSQDAADVFT